MKKVIVIGASGSIGRQTLDVIARHRDSFRLVGMSAHSNADFLATAACEHDPRLPLCLSAASAKVFDGLSDQVRYFGAEGLDKMVRETDADIVVNAAAGSDGLAVSFAALESGKHLALANKESIVMAGRLVLALAKAKGLMVIPVDSEHSAIFNMIERFGRDAVRGVVITASGGAFRDCPAEDLPCKTVSDALSHPTWNMGVKITIDSATMANKGLEVIEAAKLFSLATKEIDVVIHPESRVHSFIRTLDGSLYAQISRPDMRLPILNALAWPNVATETIANLDVVSQTLSFRPVDPERYPLLGMAYKALELGEGACCAYNAANEIAVTAFMRETIPFTEIAAVTKHVLERSWPLRLDDRKAVMDCDAEARECAKAGVRP